MNDPVATSLPKPSSSSPPTVVLVEDDMSVRRSMTMLFRGKGLLVDVYQSGMELLSARGGHSGSCLLIDYKMPGLDGLEVLKRLRAAEDNTPAMLITGYYSATLRTQALEAGYSDVFEKPMQPAVLLSQIDRLLN